GTWTSMATGISGSSQWTTTGSNIYYNSGSVGVGTTNPTSKLHVAGGDALINTMTVGLGSGGLATNNGNWVCAPSPGTNGGDQNVAAGYQALQSNTTGSANTAAGYQALQTNTTGGNQTAFGWSALSQSLTGQINTAIGEASQQYADGTQNTALGAGSLRHATG